MILKITRYDGGGGGWTFNYAVGEAIEIQPPHPLLA